MSSPYPVFLRLEDHPVVLIGGGSVAERRLPRLLDAGARVTVVSPTVAPGIEDAVRAGAATWHSRPFEPADLDGVRLAFLAVGDPALLERVRAEADRRNVLLSTAEDGERADFHVPAVARFENVQLAVSTSGRSPSLARTLRGRLEAWVRGATCRPFPRGAVALVGGGPGDPGLLTVRALELLEGADVVYYDRLVSEGVLSRIPPSARRVYVGKEVGRARRANIVSLLVESARAGDRVVRLKGGDPNLFGRGGEEAHALRMSGIDYEVVSGVSSLCSVPASAGIPVTHRHVASQVVVRSGHALADQGDRAPSSTTFVYFMAAGRIERVVRELLAEGVDASTPVALVEQGTLESETVITATVGTIAARADEAAVAAPALIVVGDVVRFRDPADFERLLDSVQGRASAEPSKSTRPTREDDEDVVSMAAHPAAQRRGDQESS